jgi:hypothetical protein
MTVPRRHGTGPDRENLFFRVGKPPIFAATDQDRQSR